MKAVVLILLTSLTITKGFAQTDAQKKAIDNFLKKTEASEIGKQKDVAFYNDIIEPTVLPVCGLVDTDPTVLGKQITSVHLNGKLINDTVKTPKQKFILLPAICRDYGQRTIDQFILGTQNGVSNYINETDDYGDQIPHFLTVLTKPKTSGSKPNVTTIRLDGGDTFDRDIRSRMEPASISLSEYINQTDIYGDQLPHFLIPEPVYGKEPVVRLF